MKTLTNNLINSVKWRFRRGLLSIVCCLLAMGFAYAGPPKHSANTGSKVNPLPSPLLNGCTPGAAMTDLTINNVRARMCTGGDMWWDYAKQIGQYEVPYNPQETSPGPMPIYAGALWVGGINAGNLYLAGQEYRNGGNDWWPGPLDTLGSANITPDVCLYYDQHYKITQAEVAAFASGTGPATTAITNWPGNSTPQQQIKGVSKFLAPFVDLNGNGKYEPALGDYPAFDLYSTLNCQVKNCVPVDQLFGDECLWFVINDKGNIHTQTQGLPMGLEVHIQTFGFSTDDEINSMTFVNYRMYNRSSLELDSTFMAQWCDPDLGCATDDHVGCDVTRGVGYVYNETNNDVACSGELGYGASPPAMGIDFFRGPVATDHKFNYNHTCPHDTVCEDILMTHFCYFTNGAPQGYGDPTIAKEYYNYMTGSWANGNPMYYGGTGYPPTSTSTPAAYTYCWNPATGLNSDPVGWGIGGTCANHIAAPTTNWWDPLPGNPGQDDRRFVESAGPFKLMPGAVNVVTVGVVWARSTGGNLSSVNLMLAADDKAQKLFDNCFKVLNGPDAPDLTIQELNNKLIIYITNKPTSNNYNENYLEYDPSISLTDASGIALHCIDSSYHFEGYRIFQLKDGTVSAGDLYNADGSVNTAKAQQIAECDVKNGVSTIVNYVFNQDIGASVPMTEVQGADKGIFHSHVVTTDAFNGTALVNHQTYYFMATAYGYNNYKPYKQDVTPNLADNICANFPNGVPKSAITPAYDGQKKPYKQGRRNIQSYSAIPHISTPYTGGTNMEGSYGSGTIITRVEGNGNGGNVLDFNSATTNAILSSASGKAASLTYLPGKGPLNVSVVDPLNVPVGESFTLKFDTLSIIAYKTASLTGGAFKVGETVKGGSSNATGVVIDNYRYTLPPPLPLPAVSFSILHLSGIVGTFKTGETITGVTSGATALSIPKTLDNADWILTNNTTGTVINSDKTIHLTNEQLFLQYGLAISIGQPQNPGGEKSPSNNGFLEATMSSNSWLTGVQNDDASTFDHWIRSGVAAAPLSISGPNSDTSLIYESLIVPKGGTGGTWAPYALTPYTVSPFNPVNYYTGPRYDDGTNSFVSMADLASVDIVLTSNQANWTRCDVLEMCEDTAYAQHIGGNVAKKFDKRVAPSVDKNGNPDGTGYGMSWFPGYAINLETGERLNMAFGSNSALTTIAGRGVITYNLRGTISYTLVKGHFSTSETIIDSLSKGTAVIVNDNGSNSMEVQSIRGNIFPADTIYYSNIAKAGVISFTANTFQLGETVTGTTSGATGVIKNNNQDTTVMIVNITSGTFVAGEEITGALSGAIAGITSYSPYNFEQNGADMKWNPTSVSVGKVPWDTSLSAPVFGGQHYIYVFGHNNKHSFGDPNVPRYDAAHYMDSVLSLNGGHPITASKRGVFRDAMWVNFPLLVPGHNKLESDVTIRLRVGKPYKTGYATVMDTAASSQNKNLPMYTFGTDGIATQTEQKSIAVSALDLINVVPNPYYAYSSYETSNLDNRIRITNLPEQCTVSIYNLGGTLIKRIKKGEQSYEAAYNSTPKSSNGTIAWHDGSLDWDLKNTAGTPVSSGVYLIHVEVPGVGEKVIKWFGIMRPIDLGSF